MATLRKKIFFSAIITFGLFWLFVLYAQLTLPNAAALKIQNPKTTAFMERYKGEKPLQYAWVPYSQIAPALKEAVVVAEDGSFFLHSGFDWRALRDAFRKNMKKKKIVRGGSTITQQLAKNLYLSPSRNPLRKIRETLITMQLEQNLSKQRILEIYLNVIEWGEGVYGAEAAALHYFNTSASRLSGDQSAWLAAILPNPKFYEKRRNSRYIRAKASRIAAIMGYKKDRGHKKLEEEPKPVLEEPVLEEPVEAVPTDIYDVEEIAPEDSEEF
ncbi:MAG: monofunctional biosynthetic peptidoglycan transglycosylase [Deltaproteobacteria bacterium]|nr:monofunctional biosynthetic peptidoglycan transglycosylase [Deltaproteobacteria bacterium]